MVQKYFEDRILHMRSSEVTKLIEMDPWTKKHRIFDS